jgi:hypothetical protein
MKGKLVHILEDPIELKPGEYGLYNGNWWVYPPKEGAGPVNISTWSTTFDNETATLTVSPSINVIGRWHGFLKNGEWSEC